MSRSPRRPPRQRPLPGCTGLALGQPQSPQTVVRPRPPRGGGLPGRLTPVQGCKDVHPSFLAFYRQWVLLFRVLNRPWKWVVATLGLVLLSMVVGGQIVALNTPECSGLEPTQPDHRLGQGLISGNPR